MNVFSFTEKEENIFTYIPWFFLKEKIFTQVQVKNWKRYKKNFIIYIDTISDRSTAKKFTNSNIIISRHQLPLLQNNEYYWNDIISYKVFNINKIYLGIVIDLIRTKDNDILVVRHVFKKLKKNIFIPFIEQTIIQKIDSKYKYIIVRWN